MLIMNDQLSLWFAKKKSIAQNDYRTNEYRKRFQYLPSLPVYFTCRLHRSYAIKRVFKVAFRHWNFFFFQNRNSMRKRRPLDEIVLCKEIFQGDLCSCAIDCRRSNAKQRRKKRKSISGEWLIRETSFSRYRLRTRCWRWWWWYSVTSVMWFIERRVIKLAVAGAKTAVGAPPPHFGSSCGSRPRKRSVGGSCGLCVAKCTTHCDQAQIVWVALTTDAHRASTHRIRRRRRMSRRTTTTTKTS